MPDAHCGRQHAGTAPKYVALRHTPGTASAILHTPLVCTNSLRLLLWRQSAHSMACYPRRCFSVVCLQSFNQAPHTRTLVADVVSQVVVPPLRMIVRPGTALQSDVMHVLRHWSLEEIWPVDVAARTVCCARFLSRTVYVSSKYLTTSAAEAGITVFRCDMPSLTSWTGRKARPFSIPQK